MYPDQRDVTKAIVDYQESIKKLPMEEQKRIAREELIAVGILNSALET